MELFEGGGGALDGVAEVLRVAGVDGEFGGGGGAGDADGDGDIEAGGVDLDVHGEVIVSRPTEPENWSAFLAVPRVRFW